MKVAELTGVLLDYWTACADGKTAKIMEPLERLNNWWVTERTCVTLTPGSADWWQPFHVYWGSAGPIIEREKIGTTFGKFGGQWHALVLKDHVVPTPTTTGPTPLIAAMRAFITSKFGTEVPDQ